MTTQDKWDPPKHCKYCGCELERPLRSACDPCKAEHYREYHREWEQRNPTLQARREANPRRKREAPGCLDCGAEEVRPGTAYCKNCGTARSKASYEKNYAKHRARRTLKLYGITQEEFDQVLRGQDGKCAICKVGLVFHLKRGEQVPEGCRIGAVDHDHETDEVRGMLCTPCNTALGSFQDSIPSLLSAVSYLEKYSSPDKQ